MAVTQPGPLTPLNEARQWLRERVEKGEQCPCCTQFTKVYKRTITATSARALIALYRWSGLDFGHLPTVLGRKQADETKMAYWGLIEEELLIRPDGGRAGWWRVTHFGERWLRGEVTVPKYARIFDGRCLGMDESSRISISDALGQPFDLMELMAR